MKFWNFEEMLNKNNSLTTIKVYTHLLLQFEKLLMGFSKK